MSDIIQVADLEKTKFHNTFHVEAVTGKVGGLAGGADIDFTTNAVTGQVQATLPYILNQIGGVIAFDFATGGTLNLRREFVQDATFGVWQWTGALPHVVAPATDPTIDSNWVQIYTRSAAEITKDGGGSLQDTANTVDKLNATNYMSIYLYGGSPYKTGAENLSALRAAKAATGSVYFPNVDTGGSTYLIDGITTSDMLGLRWYADGLVLISVDSNQYDVNTGSVFMTDIHFYYRDKLFQFTAKANNQAIDGGLRLGVQKARSRIDGVTEFIPDNQLRGLSFDTQTDATFSPISITDNGYYKSLAAVTGKTAGLFTNIAIGETISAVVNNNVFSNNNVGVCVKSNTGYYTILKDPTVTGSSINLYINVGGTTATGTQGYQHQGLLTSYEIQNSTIAVTRLNKTDWKVTLNGDDIGPTFTGIGDITEVGFVAQSLPATADVNIDVFGISKQRSRHFTGVAQMEQIIVYGDSTADDFNGTFVQYLKQSLEGANGAKVVTIVNRAVAGTTIEEAYARLVSDVGSYVGRFIVLMAGTNNIQGAVPLTTSLATLNQFFDYADANSKKLIVVEPSMWYPKEIVSNNGQTTAAYEFGAKLRSCMQYETARRGYTFVRNTQLKCRPDYNLIGTDNDPSVRDNIHQSAAWMQEDAQNIAEHILHSDSKITLGWMQLPKLWLASGWSSGDGEYCIVDGALIVRGSFSASAPLSNGANILNIPYVVKGGNFPAISTDLTTTSACYVNVTNAGVVTLQQIQSALHNIIILNVAV